MGNLKSVSNAFNSLGVIANVTSLPEDIIDAEKVVLPGVGAFGDAMKELEERNLTNALKTFVAGKKPFLGICLGLQLLFEKSDENPSVPGLGIFKGTIKRFDQNMFSEKAKIPHMGWNTVSLKKGKCPLTKNVPDDSYFYFVHSYFADATDLCLGETNYGINFASMVWRDNVYAAQFHPEKSQDIGLQMLQNFINL